MRLKISHIIFVIGLTFFNTLTFANSSIVGTWQLTAFEANNPDKSIAACYSPSGLLTYSSNGYMAVGFNCMQAANSHQANFASNSTTFYTGKYKVEGNKVIHFTENASNADYYHKTLVRNIDLLTDDQLILSLKVKGGTYIVKWKRVA